MCRVVMVKYVRVLAVLGGKFHMFLTDRHDFKSVYPACVIFRAASKVLKSLTIEGHSWRIHCCLPTGTYGVCVLLYM